MCFCCPQDPTSAKFVEDSHDEFDKLENPPLKKARMDAPIRSPSLSTLPAVEGEEEQEEDGKGEDEEVEVQKEETDGKKV